MEQEDNIPHHIQITDKKKVSNPYYKGTTNQFYGKVDDFDFGHQLKNYNELCEKLKQINVMFDEIYASSIERKVHDSIQYGTTFIATTSTPRIYWYKYESKAIGSGGNHMFIDGFKYKVTDFLKIENDRLVELFQHYDGVQ